MGEETLYDFAADELSKCVYGAFGMAGIRYCILHIALI